MTGSVGDVVAQLLAARERLAEAAATASRARADATEAHERYSAASEGTDHPDIRGAIAEIGVAGAKTDKVARLINDVRDHLANYITRIAPSAAPDINAPAGLPDGERLVTNADRAANRFRRAAKRTLVEGEGAGDLAKKLTEYFEAIRPTGSASTEQRSEPAFVSRTKAATPSESAEALVVTAAAVLAAVMKAISYRQERKGRQSG